ncbi:MAG: PEGA domain-containing protein [Acidobacteria bacterium]|nr:PEGA domain-containing protein [Acidobacteriota bacterium]
MNRQLLVVLGLIVVALGAAWIGGVFESTPVPAVIEAPAEPIAPAPTAPAAGTLTVTPRPADPRPTVTAPLPVPVAPPTPTTATLRINSDVPGAQVFVDNKFVGTAPATVNGVAPGQRKVNVQAPGYESVAEFVDVSPGERDIVISLKTIRLDQKVAVKHNHRAGSCEGTLIATPDGIRYQTTNANDGFSVALTGIDVFEVDFLKNNLRIRVRGGRTYDFADVSGRADGIYLFHQEVEKVRQRIK